MDKLTDLYYNKIRDKLTDKRFLSIALLVVFVLALAGLVIGDYIIKANSMLLPNPDSIKFSAESGYYKQSVEVEISLDYEVPFGAKLCYSTDGEDPDIRYNGPITLEYKPGETNIYVLKAGVYFFGRFSGAESRTFMIGDSPLDMDFISVAADYDSLYDYKTGIFEAGETYDKNVEAGAAGFIGGNYSMRGEDWIRDAQFTFIDSEGNTLVSQDVGLGVAGGTSSAYSVKSLRIIGENEFTDKGKITLDISPYDVGDFSLNDTHNSLRLRSGSQDLNIGNVRSAVVSRLATEAGFGGSVGTRRALVFLNGSFYGICDIQQNFTEAFIRQRYSLPDSQNIKRIESSEMGGFTRADVLKYFDADLTVKANRDELESYVDLDNYFTYYAVECLIGNTDWPDNNVKMWAYTGGYDGVNPYTDGRYRFLIFDTDLSYYMKGNNEWFEGCFDDNLVNIMESRSRGTGSQLPKLMKIDEYRERFLTILSDMLAGAFSHNNVMKVIDEEIEKVDAAYRRYCSEEANERRLAGLELLKTAASQRDTQIREDCEKYFGCNGFYSFKVKPSEGVTLSWINRTVYPDEEYSCDYFDNAAFTVSAEPSPDYEFDCFLLNGERIDGDTVVISSDKAVGGEITLEAVCRKKQGGILVIDEFTSAGNDWMRFKNVGDEAVKLSDYFISDTLKNYRKYQLPDISLASGEEFTLYCDGNAQLSAYLCNFKLAGGETLSLYNNAEGELVQSVLVPNMGKNETYRRYLGSSKFRFFKIGVE